MEILMRDLNGRGSGVGEGASHASRATLEITGPVSESTIQ